MNQIRTPIRVLVVTPFFPPIHNAQSFQIRKVCDTLSADGIDLCVIACGTKDHQAAQNEIRRTVDYNIEYIPVPNSTLRGSTLVRLERRLGLLACRYQLFFRRAQQTTWTMLRTWKPDVLLTIHTPVVSHLLGARVKRQYPKLPWISFFSDPWPMGVLPKPYRCATGVYWIERKYLRSIIASSDAVGVTSRFAQYYLERAAGLSVGDRCFVLPHCGGVVLLDTSSNRPHTGSNGTSIDGSSWLFHAGALSGQRESMELLKAVQRTAERYPQQFSGLLVAGEGQDGNILKAAKMVGAQSYIKTLGVLPQGAVMKFMSKASCNLVVEANMPESPFCPSKLADYATAGRPILAITPPRSEIRELFEEYGGGLAISDDADEISWAIEQICVAGSVPSGPQNRLQEYFTQANVARAYHEVFNFVLSPVGRST